MIAVEPAAFGTQGQTTRAPVVRRGVNPILPVSPDLDGAIRAATLDALANHTHDAIVVGAGATGGLAALMLAEAGLRVLVLDAGWRKSRLTAPVSRTVGDMVRLLADPRALRVLPPGLIWKGRQALKRMGELRQPVQSQCYAWERLPEAFVDDRDQPYVAEGEASFSWFRA